MRTQSTRIVFTVLIVVYAVLPSIAEFNETHVFNPEWPGHARLHNVWFIAQNALLGILALYLIWGQRSRENLMIAGLIGTLIFGGFLIAGITAPIYDGTFTDPGAEVFIVNGRDINVFVMGVSFVLSLIGLGLTYTSEKTPATV
ncbi:MAG: DUF6640 family protein [Chloroflexota bacterium]